MSAWRHAAAARLRAWAARRHGRDALPAVVDRRRIYILPTGRGLALAALVGAMTIAGLNYASNLGLAFAFLIASTGLVGMHRCHRNLLGLGIDALPETDAFAGDRPRFHFTLTNPSGLDRHDLEIRCGTGAANCDVPAGTVRSLELPLAAAPRGVLRFGHFELRTRFPFGWFRAWTYVQAPLTAYVAPRPAGARRAQDDTGATGAPAPARDDATGDADFAGLRPYAPGVPLKHMAWKALAHGGEPAVRHYAGAKGQALWIDWNALEGLPTEARLAQLCRWILESGRAGRRFGLRLPDRRLEPATGPAQRRRALRALAAFGTGDA
ncbi:MAG TPA: DUF58 domain-containing protein [Steroidobacteraceae bacterium]|nr:DUF58 domain-containing protein [Steroidobacteraceae bacterium]